MSFRALGAATLMAATLVTPMRVSAAGPEAVAVTPALATQMDEGMQLLTRRLGYPSLAIVVAQNGHIVYGKLFVPGVAPGREPVYEVGAATKQFVAAAILQLAEHKKLALDDALEKYVPNFPHADDVTLRELLAGTSGIPDYTAQAGFASLTRERVTPRQLIDSVARLPLHFKPGTRWEYSNTNFVLLGLVVERASGMPLARYMQQNLFAPAHMTSTWFENTSAAGSRLATGYAGSGEHLRADGSRDVSWAYGAGGLVSTATDLAKWDIALQDGAIVSPRAFALMTQASAIASNGSAHGYGVDVAHIDGVTAVEHNGAIPGYGSANITVPADRLAVVALTNTSSVPLDPVVKAALGFLYPNAMVIPRMTMLAQEWVRRLQTGRIDRSQLDVALNKTLTPAVASRLQSELAPFGEPVAMKYVRTLQGKGSHTYAYYALFKSARLRLLFQVDNDGKIAGIHFQKA